MSIIELLTLIAQILTIFFFIILQYLVTLIVESFNIKPNVLKYFRLFMCLILPMALIIIGGVLFLSKVEISILDLPFFWYPVISVVWLGIGILNYGELRE